MDHFDEAGLLPALKEKKYEVKWGARFIRGEQVCQFDFSEKFSEGWGWTWQVPRADFDNTLAQEIIAHAEAGDDLFIPRYDDVFREVLERYHADFRAEGRHSYDYKLASGRVDAARR